MSEIPVFLTSFLHLFVHQGIKMFQNIALKGVRKLCAASFISQEAADAITWDSNTFSDCQGLDSIYLGQ